MIEKETEKDLRFFWRVLCARKHFFIWPAVAIVFITAIVALALPPIYESTSTILIEEQQIPPDFVRTLVTGLADQRIQSLNQQILSRTRLLEIIRQFNLYPELRNKYTNEEIIEKMRKDIRVDLISAQVSDKKRGQQAQGGTVTIAFTVAYLGNNPEVVQRVNGMLVSLYLQENLKIRELQAKTTTQFLESELKGIKERITDLGDKITAFKGKHETIIPELQQFNRAQAENLERQIEQINVQIKAVEERKFYLEGQLATVNPNLLATTSSGERLLDPATRLKVLEVSLIDLQSRYSPEHPDVVKVKREIAELTKVTRGGTIAPSLKKERLAKLQAELAQKQGRYADQHPEVVKLRKEIAELEKMPEEAKGVKEAAAQPDNPAYVNLLTNVHAAANSIQALKKQNEGLEAKLAGYRRRIEEAPKVEQEYLALTRDYQNAHAKHQEIMNKILEARISEGMEESQKGEKFTLIDPASYPEKPVSPKRGLIFLAGLILSLGAGLGMVALTENHDHSVKSADELAWLTGLPVMGSIARIVTLQDEARKKKRKRLIWSLSGLTVLAALLIFHLFIMDLWTLAGRVSRFLRKSL